jgi:asparagine synthase family protein
MERDLTGGALADLGIIDVNVLREKFSLKLLSSEFLFELQELASIERWARHVC